MNLDLIHVDGAIAAMASPKEEPRRYGTKDSMIMYSLTSMEYIALVPNDWTYAVTCATSELCSLSVAEDNKPK